MAKPRKAKNDDAAKSDNNSAALVRHQKLCLSIDLDRRQIHGSATSQTLSLSLSLSCISLPNYAFPFRFLLFQAYGAGNCGAGDRDCRVTRREFGDWERFGRRRARRVRVLPPPVRSQCGERQEVERGVHAELCCRCGHFRVYIGAREGIDPQFVD